VILIKHTISAEELMRVVVQPIRLYAKKDSTVIYELIAALQFIETAPNISAESKNAVAIEIEALREDIDEHIGNEIDKKRILTLFNKSDLYE